MFGYIAPLKSEPKVKELSAYKAFYCGLCRSIRAMFGQLPRLALSYDCAYIALLLSGLKPCNGFSRARCGVKPHVGQMPIANGSAQLNFAAALNVLLAYYKAVDDWHDEKSVGDAAAALLLRRACKKASAAEPTLAKAVERGISSLSTLEKQRCPELDAPADAFGNMMKEIFACAPAEGDAARVLCEFGYNIGKWLYLVDAWDDREKDSKKGAYNPFNICGAGQERAEFNINFSLNRAIMAYDLLDICTNREILDNIIYQGCVSATKRILGGVEDEPI